MRKSLSVALLFALLLVSAFVLFHFSFLSESPFARSFLLDYPYKVVLDSAGNSFIIDISKRRVLKIDSSGGFVFEINGGRRGEGTFFYANDLAVDARGNLYVLNLIPDEGGFYTKREEILRFSPKGEFLGTLYVREHDQERTALIQRGELLSLECKGEVLSWFAFTEECVLSFKLDFKNYNRLSARVFMYPEANSMLYDIKRVDDNRWIFSTKRGEIALYDFSEGRYVSSTMVDEREGLRVRYSLLVSGEDIYYTDIGDLSLYRYIPEIAGIGVGGAREEKVFSIKDFEDVDNSVFYFASVTETEHGKLYAAAIGSSVVYYDSASGELVKTVEEIEYTSSHIVTRLIVYLAGLLALFLIIYLTVVLYRRVSGRIPPMLYRIAGVIAVVAVATAFIVTMMLADFSQRFHHTIIEKSSVMVQLISQRLNGDHIANIRSQSDYMGEDYRAVRDYLMNAFNYNQDRWNKSFYFAIYRVINGVLCGFMYLSDEIGPVYPFMDGWFEEEGSIASLAFKGAIAHEKASDAFGTWIYSMGPIKNSNGEIVALIEIGTDLYSFEQQNKELIRSTLLDVFTMLIVLILATIEILYLGHLLAKRKDPDSAASGAPFAWSSFVRPFTFLFTLSVGISIAFVPILMKDLYAAFMETGAPALFGLPEEVVIALPLSIEMLFFGIALLLGGILISKIGWAPLLLSGIALALTGLILSGYSSYTADVFLLLIGRAVVGFGAGFVLLASRKIVNLEKDPGVKSSAYSNFYSGGLAGATVGAVFGGFLAEHLGFSNVFYIAFCFGIAALIFAYNIFIVNRGIITGGAAAQAGTQAEAPAVDGHRILTLFKFLFNIKIVSYFLLIIVPTYSAGMFLAYYLPLFAEAEGLALSDIGRIFMLHGLVIIYLGPVVSRLAKKIFTSEKTALMVGSLGWALALILFAVTGNTVGLVLTVIAMALTEGFCVVAQNDYFLNLRIVQKTGEDAAVSYFEIAAKLAEMAAPIVFGAALLLGASAGMWVFGIAILIATLLFFILSNIKGRQCD